MILVLVMNYDTASIWVANKREKVKKLVSLWDSVGNNL